MAEVIPDDDAWGSHAQRREDAFRWLVDQRGDLSWNPYEPGFWSAVVQDAEGPRGMGLRGSHPTDPIEAIEEARRKWEEAGSPPPRFYEPEEADAIGQWTDSRLAAIEAGRLTGKVLPHPFRPEVADG
ncbi:MAG: hypothetical protein KC501_27945 [Myxococcales bacterium]|nr:hypothetical protein [Myxococcales bacterium]